MARYLVEAHLKEGRSVAELAAQHGIHRSWLYKLLKRFDEQGEAGLVERSRRPRTSPTQVSADVEERIVVLRKHLTDLGYDAGASTIRDKLETEGLAAPSVTTIWRVLSRRGFVTPQPHKRPRSSYVRFQADLPNELWQTDMTHFSLDGDVKVEIVNFLDDCSRLCVASRALYVTKAVDVAVIFQDARARLGSPKAILSDNGCIYTAKHRSGKVVLETECERLGIELKRSRPYHPQTCGKVERFHQTMKKALRQQPPAKDLVELQGQIDTFVEYYNDERRHRAVGRRTPREVFDSKVKARPDSPSSSAGHFRVRHDKVHPTGNVTLRYGSKLRHVGLPRSLAGEVVEILVVDRDVRVVTMDGRLIRHFLLDPARDYQPMSLDVEPMDPSFDRRLKANRR